MKTARWHTCNILHTEGEDRHLWQFQRDSSRVALAAERKGGVTETLPERLVRKTWRNLWQRKVNVAWLPPHQVFLRVVQLPQCEPTELPAMVEFQLERLSPLPVGQIVWTAEPLPGAGSEGALPAALPAATEPTDGGELPEAAPARTQTVIVIIAARDAVEEFLGGLEGAGYLADRLELPQLQEMLATTTRADGVWVYPRVEGGVVVCLLAWWSAERLQHVGLVTVPAGAEAGPSLAESVRQMAWAGEMEGWLEGRLRAWLVADRALAVDLEPALRTLTDASVEVLAPLPLPKLAQLSAGAASRANLVPPEFAVRYRQRFIDGLWMRGLGVVGLIYLVGVLGYFGWLRWLGFQKGRVDDQVVLLTPGFQHAQQLKARVHVLQEQHNLKFAALDCWNAVAETLPTELVLTSLSFQRGKKLVLTGTVPSDQQGSVTTFNEKLSRAVKEGQNLFAQVTTRSIVAPMAGPAGRTATWSIDAEIKRTEIE